MIKGSFSASGLWSQIFMLLFLCLGGTIMFSSLGLIFGMVLYDATLEQLLSWVTTGGNTEVMKYMQGISTIGTFMVPGLFAAYLFSEEPDDLLKIQHYPKNGLAVTLVIILLTLSGTTVSDAFYRISKSFSWPESMDWFRETVEATEVTMAGQLESFLQMNSFREFVGVFLVMAILPAICEETLFRGVLQPVIKRGTGRKHLAVWLSALGFALLHLQFYTFLSIFALGAVLGYVKEWTNSLWPSVVMHLINNGSIVVAIYFFDMSYSDVNQIGSDWEYWYALPGMGIFVACLFVLYRLRERKPRMPEA